MMCVWICLVWLRLLVVSSSVTRFDSRSLVWFGGSVIMGLRFVVDGCNEGGVIWGFWWWLLVFVRLKPCYVKMN